MHPIHLSKKDCSFFSCETGDWVSPQAVSSVHYHGTASSKANGTSIVQPSWKSTEFTLQQFWVGAVFSIALFFPYAV